MAAGIGLSGAGASVAGELLMTSFPARSGNHETHRVHDILCISKG
jgi:hypothetical protein